MVKVLVIGAHPDDETIGMGGTIMKHVSDGDEVYIHIVGEGVALRHQNYSLEDIKKDSHEATKILGVGSKNVSFGGFCMRERISDNKFTNLIEQLEEKINYFHPDIVYTHHVGDANSDHSYVAKATMSAVRPIASCNKGIQRILSYETTSSTEQNFQGPLTSFHPNVFINITDYLDRKITAARCYKSEIYDSPHPRSLEGITTLAKYRGNGICVNAAEAFTLLREVM